MSTYVRQLIYQVVSSDLFSILLRSEEKPDKADIFYAFIKDFLTLLD